MSFGRGNLQQGISGHAQWMTVGSSFDKAIVSLWFDSSLLLKMGSEIEVEKLTFTCQLLELTEEWPPTYDIRSTVKGIP